MNEKLKLIAIIGGVVLAYHFLFRSMLPTSVDEAAEDVEDNFMDAFDDAPDLGQNKRPADMSRADFEETNISSIQSHSMGADNQLSVPSGNNISVIG
jgi:hypothetical protein